MSPEDAPATRKDVRELAELITGMAKGMTGMKERMTGMEERMIGMEERMTGMEERMTGIEEHMTSMEGRLLERIRDMQTELLKAFLPWQEQVRIQFRELEVNTGNSVTAIKERISIVERRLSEIEKKLLLEPPAA